MLTPSAFLGAPGHVGLDVLGMTIGAEPNYLHLLMPMVLPGA